MARLRAQDYEEKQAGILAEAVKLFAIHGYSATSINMIANACGISKALLYHYYPDKEALLFGILHGHLEDLVEAVSQAAEQNKAGEEKVHALIVALLEAYRHADAEHQVQIASLKMLSKPKRELLLDMERQLVKIFSDALAEALPDIANTPNLKPLTMSLFGMLNWHYMWFREGKELTREQYAHMVTTLILEGSKKL